MYCRSSTCRLQTGALAGCMMLEGVLAASGNPNVYNTGTFKIPDDSKIVEFLNDPHVQEMMHVRGRNIPGQQRRAVFKLPLSRSPALVKPTACAHPLNYAHLCDCAQALTSTLKSSMQISLTAYSLQNSGACATSILQRACSMTTPSVQCRLLHTLCSIFE